LAKVERRPVIFDYFAGGLLTSSLVWFWMQFISYFPDPTIASLTGPVFITFSAVSAYFVCKRTTRGHLGVGVKTALSSWLVTVLLLLSFGLELDTNLIIILLVCFVFGGLAAAYLSLKARFKKPIREPETKPDAAPEAIPDVSPEAKPDDKPDAISDAKPGVEAKEPLNQH